MALQLLEYIRAHSDWELFDKILRQFQHPARAIVALLRHVDTKGLLITALKKGVALIEDAKERFEAIKGLPNVQVMAGGPCPM
jgi:hypothetical protein